MAHHAHAIAPDIPAATTSSARNGMSVRVIWSVVALIVVVTWLVGRSGLYKPGSDFGYYLGLAGALAMLALLLYPLRKHVRWLHALGAMRQWFRLHMFLGIAGPTLILLHSTYHLGSVNATVAFYSMLIVAGSGIVGRFIYGKIHHGLYGRQATLRELQTRLGLREGEMRSRLYFAPAVEERLRVFEQRALAPGAGLLSEAWRFFTLAPRARLLAFICRRGVDRALTRRAEKRRWPPAKLKARRQNAKAMIRDYLHAVIDTAQFNTYARLFSWWHVLHVPLVYLLVVSAVVHVIAVHMY